MKNKLFSALLLLFVAVVLVACNVTTTLQPTDAPTTTTTTPAPVTTTTTTLSPTLDLLPAINPAPENVYGVYDLSVTAGVATIVYDKHGLAWTTMNIDLSEDVSRFNKLVVAVKGDGVLLVRFNGTSETREVRLNLNDNAITYQIDVRDEDAFLATVDSISLIAAPGEKNARGEVVFSQLSFDTGTAFGTTVELSPSGLNVTYGWVENDPDTYDFVTEMDDSVTFTYTKAAGQEWVFAKSLVEEEASVGYNNLKVVVSGTATKQILVKLNNKFETWITFDGTTQTINIPVTETLNQIMIFAEGGVAPVTSTFSLKSMELSYVPPVLTIDEFDVVDFETGWVDGGDAVYTCTAADGKTTVAYNKAAEKDWASMYIDFTDDLSALNTITLVVKGTATKQILFKYNNSVEKWITFDGTEQTIVIPISVKLTQVRIFAEGGVALATGSFEIISATVSYVAPGNNVNVGWAENDASTYAITTGPTGIVTVNYTKSATQEWVFMRTVFDVEDAAGMNTLTLVLQGTAGKTLLIKPNDAGALETSVTFKDSNPVVVFVSAEAFTNCLIFAEPGTKSVTGSFSIIRANLTYEQPSALERDAVVDFESGWTDGGDSVYTFAVADGKTTVNYVKAAGVEWPSMVYSFTDNLKNLNHVTLVVKGTSGKQILFKYNNSVERWITFDGTEQTIEIVLTAPITEARIFAEGGTGNVTGSFEIISATVSFAPVPTAITNGWAENDASTYTIDQDNVDGSVVVNYATKDTYQFMINILDSDAVYGLNTLTIVVQGTSGNTLLLKPNDAGALERTVTFDGTQQTFTFTATAFSKILMFAAPGTAGGQTGTFTIVSVNLTYVPAQ